MRFNHLLTPFVSSPPPARARINTTSTCKVVVHHDAVLASEWMPIRNLGFDHIRAAHPHIVTIGQVLGCSALRNSNVRIYFDLKGDDIARPLMDEILHAVIHVSSLLEARVVLVVC